MVRRGISRGPGWRVVSLVSGVTGGTGNMGRGGAVLPGPAGRVVGGRDFCAGGTGMARAGMDGEGQAIRPTQLGGVGVPAGAGLASNYAGAEVASGRLRY